MAGEGPPAGTVANTFRLRQGGPTATRTRETALAVWVKLAQALVKSPEAKDRQLAGAIARYVQQTPAAIEQMRKRQNEKQRELPGMQLPLRAVPQRERTGPDIERQSSVNSCEGSCDR